MVRRILACIALGAMMTLDGPFAADTSPPGSSQAGQIEALVDKAAALVERKGKAALAEFRTRDSEWWFGTTCLFMYDQNLNVLLNPAFPAREGTNPRGETDANGKPFHDEFLKVVQARGAGPDGCRGKSLLPAAGFWVRLESTRALGPASSPRQ
jgi:cytochrome c